MLWNYLKIAWRNLLKGKLYSFINISGLAVGIACCLLIGLYVYEELRFDRFHENADQIHRVNYTFSNEARTETMARTPSPLADFLQQGYGEVREIVRLRKLDESVIRVDNTLFREDFLVAEPIFFEVFDFNVLQGDPVSTLASPDRVMLTPTAARQFFGSTDVIGQPIQLRFGTEFFDATVGGIVEDPPQYSSIQFKVLVPRSLWLNADPGSRRGNNWGTISETQFAVLAPEADAATLGDRVNADLADQVESWSEIRSISFQPLTEIHLGENVTWGMEPTANAAYIYIAGLLGILILFIACINFTSLSIGHSVRRAREVGMRKAMGAYRSQLIIQFWGETFLVTLLALCGGLLLAEFLLPYFGFLVDRTLELNLLGNPEILGLVTGIVILAGMVAGSYPALYLSKFRPSEVFRGKAHGRGDHLLIRVLTGVQFSIAVILIIGTLFMNQQMGLMTNSNPGFDEEYVVQMDLPFEEGRRIMEDLKVRLDSETSVLMVSGAWNGLAGAGSSFSDNPISSEDTEIRGFSLEVEPDMPELLELNLVEGRYFSESTAGSGEVIVNQKLVREFGWDDPIGKSLSRLFSFENATVVGVVEDFHFQSMHQEIKPLAIHPADYLMTAYVRINGNNIQQALENIEQAWGEVAPGVPFGYTFLDDQIEQQYRADQRWVDTVELGSVIAIVISCMGLFGLAMLASVKRAKEIGIRKVLGATVANVTTTLSKDFLKPVAVGLVIAMPLAWLLMNRWLADFAYRIDLEPGTFVLAAVITLAIALATVSWQSVRAALANPVDSLRSE